MAPLVGVAVKVTEVPEQIVVVPAMETDGITLFTVIVRELLVAVAGDAQVALLVITQVMILLLFKPLSV